jgi:hypothetical protein
MLLRLVSALVLALGIAGHARAAVKFYSADPSNGTPGDFSRYTATLSPALQTTPGTIFGYQQITDDGTGTVTLDLANITRNLTDIGPEILNPIFGPGSFVFAVSATTTTIAAPGVSNVSGIGAHGPSGTAPGQSIEWGVISGFQTTGFIHCIGSPVALCNENGSAHGTTINPTLASSTYDLGTWNFDAVGDMEAATFYISATNNGGLSNFRVQLRGAFQGASLPALPFVGFGALSSALLVMGLRATTRGR